MIYPMIQMISAAKIQILFKSGTFVKSLGARGPSSYVSVLLEEYYSLLQTSHVSKDSYRMFSEYSNIKCTNHREEINSKLTQYSTWVKGRKSKTWFPFAISSCSLPSLASLLSPSIPAPVSISEKQQLGGGGGSSTYRFYHRSLDHQLLLVNRLLHQFQGQQSNLSLLKVSSIIMISSDSICYCTPAPNQPACAALCVNL